MSHVPSLMTAFPSPGGRTGAGTPQDDAVGSGTPSPVWVWGLHWGSGIASIRRQRVRAQQYLLVSNVSLESCKSSIDGVANR